MRFDRKIGTHSKEELWNEYCGFLNLTTVEYMDIQRRLMEEQLRLWMDSGLGREIAKGKAPKTLDEFREMIPLTTYEDYADILLSKDVKYLPEDPILWIQTTWEGGARPIKVAPYTKSMLDAYQDNVTACLLMSTSTGKGQYTANPGDTILYGLAPLPYATGLLPVLLDEEIALEFLPPVKEAEKMSFSERNKKGFTLGLKKGIDLFFGVGSVAYYVSMSISSLGQGKKSASNSVSELSDPIGKLNMILRVINGKRKAKKEGRELQPKDLFKLKGFMCAGTDCRSYKDELEELWGVRPVEIFAGTEPTCLGMETWARDGLYFFPDSCFYEFIPESEMYQEHPKTYLMDEVLPGEKYEIVISVLKGGAFARYRVGDMYQCIALENIKEEIFIPRFEYIDRIPDVIDIAGFTRITENSIKRAIELSGVRVHEWTVAKEFNEKGKPFLHMYIELLPETHSNHAINKEVLKDHLSIYFKYLDGDYSDLKKILGMDPLRVTILRNGTFERNKNKYGEIRKVNPKAYDILQLLESQSTSDGRCLR